MLPATTILFSCLLTCFVEATDLVISYKRELKLLKNAESPKISSLSMEDLAFGRSFGFPMALYYVENPKQLLLSDYDNTDVDIYSISLVNRNETEAVVESVANTQIESITYDPILYKLYWSDVLRYGIYSNVTAVGATPQLLHESASMQPRSITLDSCNQVLYWSDRYKINPKITAFDLKTKTSSVLRSSIENTFYHGITFDTYDQQLWWFETNGDNSSQTSCALMRTIAGSGGSSVYTRIERCYPFAVTFDRHFLYWTDWSRQAVVRLSKTDATDLIELVATPTVHGYGIVNVNRTDRFECDVALLRQRQPPALPADMSGKPVEQVAYSNAASSSNAFGLGMLPDQATAIVDMKRLYNTLHQVQLSFLALCFILSAVAIYLSVKLYSKQVKMAEWLQKYRPIDVDAFPPTEVTKPVKKFNQFVPRIIASPNVAKSSCVDIETCCQMTLCDQPCERAISKGARFSTKLKNSEDKVCLLDSMA